MAEIYKVFNVIKKLRENKLVFGGIKLDNFIIDDNQEMFLMDCVKYNESVEQTLNYDIMSVIYRLINKCDAPLVVSVSQKFFSRTEITNALKFLYLYLTSARLDSIPEKVRTKEIKLANI